MEKNDKDKRDERHICRALIKPSTSEDFDFECVAVPTENGQLRRSWENDEYYTEILGTAPENVITTRMDSGLPLFDNHPWDLAAMNTLGITVGYEFTTEGIRMKCKFGARADEALRSDITNGILKTVSIEGDIYEYTINREPGKLPIYRATKWEPTSISIAPVPNDIGAQIEVQRALKEQIKKSKNIENPEADNSILKSIKTKF